MTPRKPPLAEDQSGGVTETAASQPRIAYRGERAAGDRSFAKSDNGSLPVEDVVLNHWDLFYRSLRRTGLPYHSEVVAFVGGWEMRDAFEDTAKNIGRAQNMDLAMEVRSIARKEYDTELAALLDAADVPSVGDEQAGMRLARHLETLRHLAGLSSLELLVHAAGEVEHEVKQLVTRSEGLQAEVTFWQGMGTELDTLRQKAAILDEMERLLGKDRP